MKTLFCIVLALLTGPLLTHAQNPPDATEALYQKINEKYSQMPQYEVFKLAVNGFERLDAQHPFPKQIITVIDFSLSSTIKRMWVINLADSTVMFHNLVAHGRNSGEEYATSFSNVLGSKQSSLGFYRTGSTYQGKHGYSMYLNGLEKGINGKARERAIVMHGADYVSRSFIQKYGRLGRSFGCPAVSVELHQKIIDVLRDGSCLYIYHPTKEYFRASSLF